MLGFGINSLISAFRASNIAKIQNAKSEKLSKIISKTLAVTLLNPHVYIDTIVMVGAVGAVLNQNERIYFWLGTIFASFIWFFSLGYGAKALSKFFINKKAWQIIDFLVAVFMFYIAFLLIKFTFKF